MADKTNTTTQAQDAIKAELLERLNKTQDALCGIGNALDGLQEKLAPEPRPWPDVVDATAIRSRATLREEADAVNRAAQALAEACRDLRTAARAESAGLAMQADIRNKTAWATIMEHYSGLIDCQEDAAVEACRAVGSSANMLAKLATFAHCDVFPDDSGATMQESATE